MTASSLPQHLDTRPQPLEHLGSLYIVVEQSKQEEREPAQEEDGGEGDPKRLNRVFDASELRAEVTHHQRNGQEEHSRLGQEQRNAR